MVEQVVLPSPAVPIIKPDGRIDDTWFQRLRSLASGTNTANAAPPSASAKTGDYTAVSADRASLITVNGPYTLSLDAAATLGDTWWISLCNIGARRVTIDPDGGEFIDGVATLPLWPNQGCFIFCDGSAFYTIGRPIRWKHAPTIYVATTGNDANDGLVLGSPKLLIQSAIDFIVNDCDVGTPGGTGNVVVADGTYDQRFQVVGDGLGSNQVQITGNTSIPTNCVISPTSGGDAIVYAKDKGIITVSGFYFWSTTASVACAAEQLGVLDILHCDFGPMTIGSHLRAANGAGQININSSYGVRAGAVAHMDAEFGGRITINNATVTTYGNMNFTYWGLSQWLGDIQIANSTYVADSGSVTAQKYLCQLNGIISKGGSTFPGGTAGATATGGQVA